MEAAVCEIIGDATMTIQVKGKIDRWTILGAVFTELPTLTL